jgi:threonine dehydrogenase-like Zn-dependent dehydrogenase
VVIRVVASGICRSDWHIWDGHWTWIGVDLKPGTVLGHEVGGVVESVGSRVRSVKVGDRVTVPWHLSCGHCSCCQRGLQNLCEDGAQSNLLPGSGGWAEFMRVPNADLNCIVLPENVSELSAAALGCRYMTAWHGVHDQGAVKGGETVAIFGSGGVGLAAVEIAHCLGADVIAIDVDDEKLALAKELGARGTLNVRNMKPERVGEAIAKMTPGDRGVDVSVDALGLQHTVHSAILSLAKGGRLAQIGLTSAEEQGMATIPLDLMVGKELTLVGSAGNPHWSYDALLKLVAQGRLRPERLVTREVKLSDTQSVMNQFASYNTKGYVVITDFS